MISKGNEMSKMDFLIMIIIATFSKFFKNHKAWFKFARKIITCLYLSLKSYLLWTSGRADGMIDPNK